MRNAPLPKVYQCMACWLLWTTGPAVAELPGVITLVAPDNWCPFSCKAGEDREGFAVDIVRAAMQVSGIQVRYQNMPYERALMEVRNGSVYAAAPVFISEAPDFVFPAEALSVSEYCFYTLPSTTWTFEGTDSLNNITFVVTAGYSYGHAMDTYISADSPQDLVKMRGSNITDRMIQMIHGGRVDALLDDTRLIDYTLKTGAYPQGLRNAGCIDQVHFGYLALSPSIAESAALAELFDYGIKELKARGEFNTILDSYGVEYWN